MAVPLSPKYLSGKRAYTNFRDTIRQLDTHLALLDDKRGKSTDFGSPLVEQLTALNTIK